MNLADLRTSFPQERIDTFMDKIMFEPNSGCWIWLGAIKSGGYGSFWVGGKCLAAHRFSHMVFKGPIPDGLDVMHKCDTPACVNPNHLKAATTLENVRDAWKKGRMNDRKGSANGRAKLTEFGVRYIRDMAILGYGTVEIAEKFQIDRGHVRRIVRGVKGGWAA